MFFEDIKFDVSKHLGSAYKAVGPDWEAEFCLFDFFFFWSHCCALQFV